MTTRLEFTFFSMFWHRQAILESKGGELSSFAECRIRTYKSQDTYSPADWMPTHKPTDLSSVEDQAKNFISTARPYDDWPFSPFDFTAVWLLFLALAIYMFVVVNFHDLAQASDIRILRRRAVFLCWMQDSNLEIPRHLFASRLNAHSYVHTYIYIYIYTFIFHSFNYRRSKRRWRWKYRPPSQRVYVVQQALQR